MNKLISSVTAVSLMAFPLVASAQNAQGIINTVRNIVDQLIPLALAVALLVFFWGLIKYIWGAAGGEAKAEGQKIMTAGIVGLFLIVAIWGIVGIIANTFGIQTGTRQAPPSVSR
jgi:amino acid transporter